MWPGRVVAIKMRGEARVEAEKEVWLSGHGWKRGEAPWRLFLSEGGWEAEVLPGREAPDDAGGGGFGTIQAAYTAVWGGAI